MSFTKANVMTSNEPRAFSYTRFSTPEQSKGDSKRRQSDLATRWAALKGIELDTDLTFQDLGVSAFRGRNAEVGKLAEFKAAVESGLVPAGSYLLVESLDRISRQSARKAVRVLEDIVESGVTVVTLTDNKEYNVESLDHDPTAFLMAILIFMRSAEESQMKSSRLRSAWSNKRDTAAPTERMTRRVKSWINPETLKAIPARAKTIRLIFDLYLKGQGIGAIATHLNNKGVDTQTRAKHWREVRIGRILCDPAVTGVLTLCETGHVKGRRVLTEVGKVEGYYERVIDDETFARAQLIKEQRSGITGHHAKRAIRNVFSNILKCSRCGAGVLRTQKRGKPVLVCSAGRRGACTYQSITYDMVEETLIHEVQRLVHEAPRGTQADVLAGRCEALEADIAYQQETIEGLLDVVQKGDHSLLKRIRSLEATLEKTRAELEGVIAQRDSTSNALVKARCKSLTDAVASGDVAKMNRALRLLVTHVVYDWERGALIFHWRHDGTTELQAKLQW